MARTALKLTTTAARKRLHGIRLISDIYFRGHAWVQAAFVPAVQLLASSDNMRDRRLAAVGYYLLGDVHDFNSAPLAAIRAYRRSAQLDASHGSAFREIGGMQEALGQPDQAIRSLRRAVRISPNDKLARSDLASAEASAACRLYSPGDRSWDCREALAQGHWRVALKCIAGKRGSAASFLRARIHGACGDAAAAFTEWDRALAAKFVTIQGADWYFLPRALWRSSEFWRLFWKRRSHLKDWGFLKGHESLRETGLTGRQFMTLWLRFRLAKTQRDFRSAARLHAKHPAWKEAAGLARRWARFCPVAD